MLPSLVAGFAVARTLRENLMPEPTRLGVVAALLGQHGQVAPGQVAVDPLIDAAKLLGTLQGQDPPPARLRLGRLARLAVDHRLAEEQLGVVGVEREPLGAGGQGRGRSPSIWWQRAIRANSFRVIESVGAEPARLWRR